MGDRTFGAPSVGGDIWQMSLDMNLPGVENPTNRKDSSITSSLSDNNHIGTGNISSNFSYGEILLQKFDNFSAGDISQITDMTNTLQKGGNSYELNSELNSMHNPISNNALFDPWPLSKQNLYPIDVFGRVSLYEGKLVIQLRHFNVNTNYPFNIGECWLCREKMKNGVQINSHKHILQGLFQVNNEFIQMDIDHYIIPEEALESDHGQVDVNQQSVILAKNAESRKNLAKSCHKQPVNIENNHIHSENQLELPPVHAEALEHNSYTQYCDRSIVLPSSQLSSDMSVKNESYCINNLASKAVPANISCTLERSAGMPPGNFINLSSSKQKDVNSSNSSVIQSFIDANEKSVRMTDISAYESNNNKGIMSEGCHNYFENSYYEYQQYTNLVKQPSCSEPTYSNFSKEPTCSESSQSAGMTYQTLSVVKEKAFVEPSKRTEIGAKKRKSKAQKKPSNIRMRDEASYNIPFEEWFQHDLYNSSKSIETAKAHIDSVGIGAQIKKELPASSQYGLDGSKSIPLPNLQAQHLPAKQKPKTVSKDYKIPNEEKQNKLAGFVECQICRKPFKNLFSFKLHLQEHKLSPSFVFLCCRCSRSFSHIDKYICHLETHLRHRVTCQLCCNTFSNLFKLRRHTDTVHQPNSKNDKYKCNVCSKYFQRPDHFKTHLKVHSREKEFCCNTCKKFYSSEYNLHVHLRNHANKRPYVCEFCGKPYPRKNFLATHISSIHQHKKFKCDVCLKLFSRIDVLARHKLLHSDIRLTYDCELCGKKFSRKDRLNAHRAQHKFPLKIKCSQCPSTFRRKETLQKHLIAHKNKEQCNICHKFLPSSVRLQKHLRWHESQLKAKFEKEYLAKYKCSICSKSFKTNEVLYRHTSRVHHKMKVKELKPIEREKRFACEYCPKSFTRSCNLRGHMKSHTKGSEDEEMLDDLPTVLNATRTNIRKNPQNYFSTDNPNKDCFGVESITNTEMPVTGVLRMDHIPPTFQLPLDDGFSPISSSAYGSHFPPNLPTELPISTSSFCNSSPSSPLNLSTEAITAAAYLLAHPFYEGPY